MLTFLKNWTLPVAIVMGTVAYLLFANIPALDSIGTAMAPVFYDSLPWFMFFILLVTFCKIDFRQLLPVAWHFYEAVVQVLLVVIVVAAVLLLRATGDTLTLLEAVLCCVIAPCACAAAVVTAKMGGNMAQVTTYNFLSNLITALLVPVAFPLVLASAHKGVYGAGTAYGRCLCGETLYPGTAPPYRGSARPLFLPLGGIAGYSHRHHGAQYSTCTDYHGLSRAGGSCVAGSVCDAVCHRAYDRCTTPPRTRGSTEPRAEKHILRHLDSIRLSQSAQQRRSGMLHPMAELYQQRGIVVPSPQCTYCPRRQIVTR